MKSIQQSYLLRAAMMPMLAAVFTIACYSQDSKGGGRLVGTWDAAVTIRNCVTGDAVNTFASIASFNQGGTTIGSTSGMPQSARTPEHGVWRHVRGNLYTFKFKSFNFDPAGVSTGYGIVEHRIELDETGNNYISYGTARFFLMNGTQVAQGCSDAIGTRFDL
jgi:uncharacterized protein YfiM (DUF2279 family)